MQLFFHENTTNNSIHLSPEESKHLIKVLRKTKGDKVLGFAIAGADNKFVWAEAAINGTDDVLVWSPQVPQPTHVRFGYIQFQDSDLYNMADLPLVPFRTDDLPFETKKGDTPPTPQS
jgi:sialate O-acetylesterase